MRACVCASWGSVLERRPPATAFWKGYWLGVATLESPLYFTAQRLVCGCCQAAAVLRLFYATTNVKEKFMSWREWGDEGWGEGGNHFLLDGLHGPDGDTWEYLYAILLLGELLAKQRKSMALFRKRISLFFHGQMSWIFKKYLPTHPCWHFLSTTSRPWYIP